MVLYRKYRPQKLSEVVGQDHVRNSLTHALSSSVFSHAYLFSGPRGTGKTTTARIVAKAINCREGKDGEPCNKCSICTSITDGSALDLIEIDAASNRGIDEIRDLRDKIKLAPSQLAYKIYIIDEVHMLTTEAFNALLKTLEEPPKHAVFILCTTEPQKLPATIISRCQRFDFKRPTIAELMLYLERLVKGEERKVQSVVLGEIAKQANGAYRDAAVLLEKIFSSFDPKQEITTELVAPVLELESGRSEEIVDFIMKSKVGDALVWLNSAAEKGINLKILNEAILRHFRCLLLIKSGAAETLVKPNVTDEDYQKMQEQACFLDSGRLEELIGIFSWAERELKQATIIQLPLEMAVIKACSLEIKSSKGELSTDKKEVKNKIEEKVEVKSEEVKKEGKVESRDRIEVNLGGISDKWDKILETIKPHNHSVEALLKSCRPTDFDGQILTIEAFYPFHRDRLSEGKVLSLVEQIATEVVNSPIRVRCVLGQRQMKKVDIANVTDASGDDEIAKLAEVFGGKVVD